MRYPSLRAAVLGLSLLTTTISAATVSLASFIPSIENLPLQCNIVYNAQIPGCVANDFSQGATCSRACVQGIVLIAEAVLRKCKDVDVGETSIIGVFLNGFGIQSLCPGVTVTTSSDGGGSTSTSTEATNTLTAVTTTSSSTTKATSTLATSTSETSSAAQASSLSSSTGGLTLDPNASGTLATSIAIAPPTGTASSTAKPTQTPDRQLSNADSGGGSPFDVVATGTSSQLQILDITGLFATAVLSVALVFSCV
ncbi:hypothetical protein EJ02DRAFT_14414 [Clathrospora elynae]|uniref:Extracellular membrane protein CFEM domain-containing protein n=1 Tax=Clathrospora elynae TaxID=706981 RepID=A0A6A5T1S6_9PLEO|nr:hypothetical protein EJ02DRAFT_14414 [Clathrospora elynae]